MAKKHSDTSLIDFLKAGADANAAQEIWHRYALRLVGLARTKLRNASRRAADEEDVALSAFNSFFRCVAAGRFPKLEDRDDLWQILVMLAERKAVTQIRKDAAAKRGAGQVRGDSVLEDAAESRQPRRLEQFADADPGPEVAAAFTDECRRLFALLEDVELRLVALQRMEGFTCEEIARSLERAPRSIERKLQTIRKIWARQLNDSRS